MTKEDIKLYHRRRNDMEVMHSTNPFLDVYPLEATKELVDQVILCSDSSKSYSLVGKNQETPIGIVALIKD